MNEEASALGFNRHIREYWIIVYFLLKQESAFAIDSIDTYKIMLGLFKPEKITFKKPDEDVQQHTYRNNVAHSKPTTRANISKRETNSRTTHTYSNGKPFLTARY
ncbi:unnamed protein product [Rotaria socialis]